MLPEIIAAEDQVASPSGLLPRLAFGAEMPNALNAGGIGIGDRKGALTPEFLQTVVFEREIPQASMGNAVVLAGSDVTLQTVAEINESASLVADVMQFLGSEYCVDGLARAVIYASHVATRDLYLSSGAYSTCDPVDVGLGVRGARMTALVRHLSRCWVGGGVAISGENAIELTWGLGARSRRASRFSPPPGLTPTGRPATASDESNWRCTRAFRRKSDEMP